MVGSAGNAPVRHFRLCFLTPDLQSGSRIASLKIGSGSGSYTHLKKFMRLLSVHWSSFPQLTLACRAVARWSDDKARLRPRRTPARQPSPAAVQRAKAGGVGG